LFGLYILHKVIGKEEFPFPPLYSVEYKSLFACISYEFEGATENGIIGQKYE